MSLNKTARRALLIVNPRGGSADRALDPALARFDAAGIDVALERPDDPSGIGAIVAGRASQYDLLILGGGDGTISGSASAVLASGKPLGVLPLGTANDFARSLGIPFDLAAAAEVIAAGRTRQVDVGLMGDRPFLNVASIGFSAEVARFHRGERKQRLKLLSYVVSWFDAYRAHRPFRVRMTLDGEVRVRRCAQLAVGSGRHYGGGLTLSMDARPDDGLLRVYYIDPVGFLAGLRLLPALRFGMLKIQQEATLLTAREVHIETRRPLRINVDGELVGRTPMRFGILPGALRVFAPADAADLTDEGGEANGHSA